MPSATLNTSTAVTYTGPITGLGSIVVNGVRFSTLGAITADEDDPTLPVANGLTLGSTVSVIGTVNAATGLGQATKIIVNGGTRGKVSEVNSSVNTFIVSGQLVTTDRNTFFQGLDPTAKFYLDTMRQL